MGRGHVFMGRGHVFMGRGHVFMGRGHKMATFGLVFHLHQLQKMVSEVDVGVLDLYFYQVFKSKPWAQDTALSPG